ncbi:MAG: alpha/beta hydrolase [Candidatus Promineifilaceae bacterium]|nr:alpha/beta hydrolase [Candidatus Promineifilaceae bacterium]
MTEKIPHINVGGSGRLLHFAHANSYPPRVYAQFLSALAASYHVVAIEQRPLWPDAAPEGLQSWHELAEDLIRLCDQEGWRDLIGVGHSLGGVATLYAALRRPTLFRALVFVEPVFLPPEVLAALSAGERDSHVRLTHLAETARDRRDRWPDRQAAFDHYRDKAVFRRWSDESLQNYVRFGTEKVANGQVGLRYNKGWEARIYSLAPTDVWRMIPQLTQPTLAIRAEASDTLFPPAWELWQQLQPEARFVTLSDVSHLAPMERPDLVARTILDFLEAVEALEKAP